LSAASLPLSTSALPRAVEDASRQKALPFATGSVAKKFASRRTLDEKRGKHGRNLSALGGKVRMVGGQPALPARDRGGGMKLHVPAVLPPADAERLPCGVAYRGPAPQAAAYFPAPPPAASDKAGTLAEADDPIDGDATAVPSTAADVEPGSGAFRGRLLRHADIALPADSAGASRVTPPALAALCLSASLTVLLCCASHRRPSVFYSICHPPRAPGRRHGGRGGGCSGDASGPSAVVLQPRGVTKCQRRPAARAALAGHGRSAACAAAGKPRAVRRMPRGFRGCGVGRAGEVHVLAVSSCPRVGSKLARRRHP
jgi:hypothetical protein